MSLPIASSQRAGAAGANAPIAVCVESVSVRYRVPRQQPRSFKEYMIRRLGRNGPGDVEFWALEDVSLEVKRGEVFGIIGRNGAGKSTLLKVVSRILRPTHGRVRVWGRVAPLLELGAGFHPELTGRENIFLNGTLLGRSQHEIRARLDWIIDFAEIGAFIDASMRTYSTGMWARLGFAVASAWEPDILIVDEVLAVGDAAFQGKCRGRMVSFASSGATILIVSHDLEVIKNMCQRAAWLDRGLVRALGDPTEVSERYARAFTAGAGDGGPLTGSAGAPVDGEPSRRPLEAPSGR